MLREGEKLQKIFYRELSKQTEKIEVDYYKRVGEVIELLGKLASQTPDNLWVIIEFMKHMEAGKVIVEGEREETVIK